MSSTKTKFTTEQRAALETRRVSIALSAGAGCGKTFVLTERFIAHLQPSDDDAPTAEKLHQLIAITFTDRAAREMRDRIRRKCLERLQAKTEHVDYWVRLLRALDTARVSTIHSFCGALLRAHAVEAKLDPQFSVIEQSQSDTLLAEIIEDLLREKLSEHDPATIQLTVQLGLEQLQKRIADVLVGSTNEFDLWLARSPTEIANIWQELHSRHVIPAVLKQFVASPETQRLIHFLKQLQNVPETLTEARSVLLAELPTMPEHQKPQALLAELRELAKVPKGGKKVWSSDAESDEFRDLAKAFRDELDKKQSLLEFDSPTAEAAALAGLQLLALAKAVHDRYSRRKQELAWLDFNDLMVRAHQLLSDPAHDELRKRLASQVKLLLVDECQDTDPVQVELIKTFCGEQIHRGKLFFVGDYKQSIYRFRGANPAVFRSLQLETPETGRLPLSLNFRSQPAILNFVNALFCEILSGDLAYQPLRASRPQITPEPAVEFLWAVVDGMKKKAAGTRELGRQREADFIARRIRAMLDNRERLIAAETPPSEPESIPDVRPVECKDIAILFRTLSNVQHYEEALRKYNIDYYLVGGNAFYAQQEIYDVANLLRTLASPADLISLAGVLRSPMFGLSDDTLFWLAQHADGLATGLFNEKLPSELAGEQRRQVEFAARTLKHLRSVKNRLSITALLNEALNLTGYDATLLAEFMGERKLANLRKLLDQARLFDQSGALGVDDFLVQLSRFIAEQPREPLAATHPEGTNVVRLMTIHQAKGLEFPVVFVPDIDRDSRTGDGAAVFDSQWGPLVKIKPPAGQPSHLCGLDLYRAVNSAEDEAERIRLFYVATTRAKDYLVLSSGMFAESLESPSAPWTDLLGQQFDLQTGAFVGRLPDSEDYRVPEVKVSTSAPDVTPDIGTPNHKQNLELAFERALSQADQMSDARPAGSGASLKSKTLNLWQNIEIDPSTRKWFSVSRLNGQIESAVEPLDYSNAENAIEQPTTFSAGGIELGIIVHQALARVNFAQQTGARQLVENLVESRTETAQETIELAAELVDRFLKTKRSGELAKAKIVQRELEFMLVWPPEVSNTTTRRQSTNTALAANLPATARQHSVYLQGFIDCLYQHSNGSWHLLDYKTNRVSPGNAAQAAKQYELQLGVYALAVEQILGTAPAEIAVHFMRTGEEHIFQWSPDIKQRIMQNLDDAIHAARNERPNRG